MSVPSLALRIRRIPVVDNNKVVGILTLGDLAKYSQKTGQENKKCRTGSGSRGTASCPAFDSLANQSALNCSSALPHEIISGGSFLGAAGRGGSGCFG